MSKSRGQVLWAFGFSGFGASCGAREATPSLFKGGAPLPWRSLGNRSQHAATLFVCLSHFRGRSICHRLPPVASARLHKCSIPLDGVEDREHGDWSANDVAGPLSSDAVTTAFRDAIVACRDRLTARGVDREAYSLAAAAQDLEDLRRALRVSTRNLVSWGTASRVLLEYTRLHPERVRALVLGSPQFLQRDPISEAVGDVDAAFDALTETCRQSKRCGREYPDLQRTLFKAVAALERSPISVRVRGTDVVVDGAPLARVVRSLISSHDAYAVGQVPRIVYRAFDRHVGTVASELASDPGMCVGYLPLCDAPRSLGAYLSFTCPDVSPPRRAGVYGGAFGETHPYLAACRAWGIEPGGDNGVPVRADVPALVLRGEYDAFSPLDLVQQINATMPRAHVVLVPHFGHDVFGVECLREARNAWLLDPQDPPEYSTCLPAIPTPTLSAR
jgi:pimeloyl-ACP methyl ester carboxylesterase